MPEYTQEPGKSLTALQKASKAASSAVLLVGDVHLDDRAPSTSTDSYLQDLLDMLDWIAVLEQKLKVNAVIFAGDIFHRKQPSQNSHALVIKAIQAFQKFENPWIVAGNHDITNDHMATLREKQPLGVLFESGAAQELNGWFYDEVIGLSLPVFGVPWQQRWSYENTPYDAFHNWRVAEHDENDPRYPDKSLVVTHAPIYPLGQELEFEFVPTAGDTGISKAMGNKGSLYYGHIHEPHGIFEVDGVTYANMGALSRGSLHEYNRTRKIQIAFWSPESGFMPIDVPHKPSEEVFRIAEVEEAKAEKLSLDQFLADVGSSTLDISSTESVVAHIRALDVNDKVKKKSVEILEQVS